MTLWITKERNQIRNSKISADSAYLYYLIPDFFNPSFITDSESLC